MSILTELAISTQAKFSLDKLIYHFSVEVMSHVVKKNGRPIYKAGGKSFIGKSKRLVGAEDFLTLQLKSQANKQNYRGPIDHHVWVMAHFYFPPNVFYTTKNNVSKTLPDLSNLLELPADCLQKAGIISNDTLIHSWDLSRRLIGSSYRLELFVLKHELFT